MGSPIFQSFCSIPESVWGWERRDKQTRWQNNWNLWHSLYNITDVMFSITIWYLPHTPYRSPNYFANSNNMINYFADLRIVIQDCGSRALLNFSPPSHPSWGQAGVTTYWGGNWMYCVSRVNDSSGWQMRYGWSYCSSWRLNIQGGVSKNIQDIMLVS